MTLNDAVTSTFQFWPHDVFTGSVGSLYDDAGSSRRSQ